MGGRALKETFTRRYTREEFDKASAEIREKLKPYFADTAIPLFFKNKETFGDIDVICNVGDNFTHNMRDLINELFSPNQIFHNGNCWSFDYNEVQVDLITVAPEHFETNKMYLSYNDLGNFIGRIAQKFGLKYGQEGLWYKHKFKGSYIGIVPISTDYPKIYNFFNLDYSKWEKGFDELEDIFKFVYESEYFDGSIFQMDQLNKINRDRNKKRSSYTSFLEWIDNQPERNYNFNEKEDYILQIDEAFPEANLIEEIRRLEYEHCKELYIKSKFSGKHIMEKYGLQGKELGDAIIGFKSFVISKKDMAYLGGKYFGESFEEYILRKTKDEIFNFFELYLASKHEW